MKEESIDPVYREFVITTKSLIHAGMLKAGLTIPQLAARVKVCERSMRIYLKTDTMKLPPFPVLFRISDVVFTPRWRYFRKVLATVNEPWLLHNGHVITPDSPDYPPYQKCLAVKKMIKKSIHGKAAEVAAEVGMTAEKLNKITSLKTDAMPSWPEWFELCAVLKFPQWTAFVEYLNQEAQMLVRTSV